MKKIKLIAMTALIAGSLPVYAGFMMGAPDGARAAAFETVLSNTDEATAAALQTQSDTVAELQGQLESLRDAEEQDDAAITEARSQLQEARQELRSDVREVVDGNSELKTALQEQREAAQAERAVTRYALRDEEAFSSLVEAASEEQAASLEANQLAMEELKAQASEAREAGASREDMQELRDQMRALAGEQKETVSEVLEANEELQSEFSSTAQEMVSEMRPSRGGRGH